MGKHKGSKNPIWERKKNAIMRDYRKVLKAKYKNPNSHIKRLNDGKSAQEVDKKTFFQRAMSEFERRKADKDRIKEIKDAKRKEQQEALKKYNEKKRENFLKVSKKTKWGQPVMGGRMEILLEKIQKSYASETIK